MNVWTDQIRSKAIEMHATHSAQETADYLNETYQLRLTRCAVIGVWHRAKLLAQRPEKKIADPRNPKIKKRSPRPKIKPGDGIYIFGDAVMPRRPPKPAGGRPLRCDPIGEPLNLDLLELEPESCRYPIGDCVPYRFCGHAKMKDSAYCPGHHAIAYWKPTKPIRLPNAA